ncbi:transcription factor JunB-like [Cololabis saira]|uniref:transcription factor JunB-like n=1 Tax=Cololabis saira TaxID=129043 RepID=UPI002AD2DEC5|nr:transcription factor JunB-like [Cololabis saira]
MSTIMEQPFYDDSFLSAYGHPGAAIPDYKLLKQNMNLNFSDCYRSSSVKPPPRELFPPGPQGPQQGPDPPGSLRLASPELERLIIHSSSGLVTPTPGPGTFLYSRGITEEQEGFADGFVKALDDLHKMNQMGPPNVALHGPGGGPGGASVFQPELEYATLSNCSNNPGYPSGTISYLPPHHHQYQPQGPHGPHHGPHHFQQQQQLPLPGAHRYAGLKEEPQTVPDMQSSDGGSPPMSPIDMESQERVKAERKRLRNRLAASKCRRRKLERIARLEDKVKLLKADNAGLAGTADALRGQVATLKSKVLTHVNSGCQLLLAPKVKSY